MDHRRSVFFRVAVATTAALLAPYVAQPATAQDEDPCSWIHEFIQFGESMVQWFAAIGDWDAMLAWWLGLELLYSWMRSMGC